MLTDYRWYIVCQGCGNIVVDDGQLHCEACDCDSLDSVQGFAEANVAADSIILKVVA